MAEEYIKTGRFTYDGEIFHYAHTNVRIGLKHYGNASEETLKGLGLYENIKFLVTEREFEAAMQQYAPEDPNFPYNAGWQTIDGERYWVSYEVIPDPEVTTEQQEEE